MHNIHQRNRNEHRQRIKTHKICFMVWDWVFGWVDAGREFDHAEDDSNRDQSQGSVEHVEERSPITWLTVEDLMAGAGKLALSSPHDEGEFDGDRGEDENAEFLKSDAAHVNVNTRHDC